MGSRAGAVRNVTGNKWPTTAPDHRATRECASCGLNRMPLGAVVRPAFIWGYVRHLFASRLCPLALRARLPARRAYRYGDQDGQQRAPDEEMGWGGMQGAKATRYNYNPRDRGQYVRLRELTGGANSGDPPATKINYTDECDAPIVAGGGRVLGAGRRAKRGSNVSLIA